MIRGVGTVRSIPSMEATPVTAAPSLARRRAAFVVGCAVATAVADWFAPTIFAGHSLVLGIVFYWVALERAGPRAALLPLLATAATLWLKWSQPYSAALVAFEGLAVGWAWRRRLNPLLADLLFWAAVGTPLSWFVYRSVYVIPHPAFGHALVVQVVNGLIAVWMAVVVTSLLPRRLRSEAKPSEKIRVFILKRYIAVGTFPLLAAVLLAGRYFETVSLDQTRQNLDAVARRLAGNIGWQINRAQQVVAGLAASMSTETEFLAAARRIERLERARAGSGPFVTLLMTDAHGAVVSSTVPATLARAPTGSLSVADREYFQAPMRTGEPYLSDVFRGRGFGQDLLVAASAPSITLDGRRLGIVEGSIPINEIADLLRRGLPAAGWRGVLTDRRHRVIAAHAWALAPLEPLADTRVGRLMKNSTAPERYTDDLAKGRESFFSLSVPVPGTGWTLTLQRPWADVLRPVTDIYLIFVSVALVAMLLAAAITTWSITGFLRAARELARFAGAPLERARQLEQSAEALREVPREMQEMMRQLAAMAGRLREESAGREQLVAELESRVQARTRELQQALVAAQTADRAKSAFLATVSHELRTPLTAIINGSALLKRAASTKSELEVRTLTSIDKSSQALLHVISDVLDYSKLEAGALGVSCGPFRPAAVLAEVAEVLAPSARQAGLAFTTECQCAPELEWQGDAARLRQVLINLAGNAIKFTPSGAVSIAACVAEPAADLPLRLCFAVRDTGPGIPLVQQQAVFEPFVQLDASHTRVQAGTGLGLSISRKLVEAMGGGLGLRSTPGEGATFEVWLPARSASPRETSAPRSEAGAVHARARAADAPDVGGHFAANR